MSETPAMTETTEWTIRVKGGPAFMENAVLALRAAAEDTPKDSPSRFCLERLADACERAEGVMTVGWEEDR